MPIAFRSSTTHVGGDLDISVDTGTSGVIAVTKPTGTVDGDFMFVTIGFNDNSSSTPTVTSVPSGWTLLRQTNQGIAPSAISLATYWKIASGEGASWSWTVSARQIGNWVAGSYSGGGVAIDGGDSVVATNSGNIIIPSISPTGYGDMLVTVFWGFLDSSVPSGMTNRVYVANHFAYNDQLFSGVTGTRSVPNAGAASAIGEMFAIRTAYAPIRFINDGGTNVQQNQSTLILTVPTNVAGDLLLAFLTNESGSTSWTGPSGWTRYDDNSATNHRSQLWYKFSNGSEPGTYTWTSTISNYGFAAGAIVSYRNVANPPIDVSSAFYSTNLATMVMSSLTPTYPNEILINCVTTHYYGPPDITIPAGMYERSHLGQGSPLFRVNDELRTDLSATGTRSTTVGGGNLSDGWTLGYLLIPLPPTSPAILMSDQEGR